MSAMKGGWSAAAFAVLGMIFSFFDSTDGIGHGALLFAIYLAVREIGVEK